MLAAAVRGYQDATIRYLFTIFPDARIQEPELRACIDIQDLAIFKQLADHARDKSEVIDREFDDRYTSLSMACLGEKPDIALFLLDQGADPNEGSPLRGIGGLLVNAIQEQVIRKLVEKGAVVEKRHVYSAVQGRRADVVKFLVERGTGLDLGTPLEEARKIGSEEIVALLEKGR
jgi:ankyrin repeat protein